MLREWGFERVYKVDIDNRNESVDAKDDNADIEIKTSEWVIRKTEFGLLGEEKAYKFLCNRYKHVTKVFDYYGYDFMCEAESKDFYEVKTIYEENFKIHLSINQLNTMMEYIDNYYILIVSISSKENVKYYQIPSFLLTLDIQYEWFNKKFDNGNCSFKSTNFEIIIENDVMRLYEENF
ncbi:protein NO VEIN domain-containing protein [Fusibacter ferrireducens]|uniref:DUF3883 domain-containing protein n=1 Tax=Fusibacter ferrireducens TaxID=2785058 RepID=A0ABR9ZNQ4_9FIRM|nr:DUF3883 domain-containing protein [Fusibacter ferrireducens]MBF4692069.1 DUF3883 domain-containing protein [Fusibacter ferrireducens]